MEYRPDRIPEDKKRFRRRRRLESAGLILLYAAVLALLDYRVIRTWRGRWTWLVPICMMIALILAGIWYLIVSFFSDWRMKSFSNESNAIIAEYKLDHNGEKLWKKLMEMQYTPQSFQQEIMWYFNLAVALCAQKRIDEALDLLGILRASAEGEEWKLIDSYIRQIRDNRRGDGRDSGA